MTIEIKSPTFPESVADGTVANWLKKEGENVEQDEVIAEIETDKVVLEVVAPTNGVLTKIVNKEAYRSFEAGYYVRFPGSDDNDGETKNDGSELLGSVRLLDDDWIKENTTQNSRMSCLKAKNRLFDIQRIVLLYSIVSVLVSLILYI